MVNGPLIRPYFLGRGGIGGVPLDSRDNISHLELVGGFNSFEKDARQSGS